MARRATILSVEPLLSDSVRLVSRIHDSDRIRVLLGSVSVSFSQWIQFHPKTRPESDDRVIVGSLADVRLGQGRLGRDSKCPAARLRRSRYCRARFESPGPVVCDDDADVAVAAADADAVVADTAAVVAASDVAAVANSADAAAVVIP